jgi:hypothetical protein
VVGIHEEQRPQVVHTRIESLLGDGLYPGASPIAGLEEPVATQDDPAASRRGQDQVCHARARRGDVAGEAALVCGAAGGQGLPMSPAVPRRVEPMGAQGPARRFAAAGQPELPSGVGRQVLIEGAALLEAGVGRSLP